MEHYTEKQYDDDLTIVADEYDDSFHTDNVDLFEFPTYDESPLVRLKSLVLSIDWEITDDVLHQFNDELVDLKDVWADEKIYLVYIQALEKISKYIYKEKADANPNAIKLLLSFYYNLEKMVSSELMTEGEKRQLLLEDVRKFEILKKQISKGDKKATSTAHGEVYADEMQPSPVTAPDAGSILFDLKALVLGIDWEITEIELERLRDEVHRLENIFAGSRPKQIFLQGLGTLAAYIRFKKSDAHADAFKLLHSFVAGLEKIVTVPMSLEEEKRILLPEVEKFNEFKAIVGAKIKPSKVEEEEFSEDEEEGGSIAPALSGLPEGGERGFQEEEEAAALDRSSTSMVEGQVDRFFTDSDEPQFEEKADQFEVQAGRDVPDEGGDVVESRLDAMFQADGTPAGPGIDREESMRGVDVESDADGESDQDRLPYQDDDLAPALSDLDESVRIERSEVVPEENIEFAADVESRLDDFFGALDVNEEIPQAAVFETEPEETVETEMQESVAFSAVETDTGSSSGITLPGVDVESEDDDDSGEEPLAFAGADLAPALSGEPEPELVATGEDRFAVFEPADRVSVEEERIAGEIDSAVDIEDRPDSFFGKEEEPAREGQTMNGNEESALTEESIEESPSDRKEEKYEDVDKIEQPSSSMFVMEVLEEGEIEEELAFEPVEEEKGGAIGEASLDIDDEAVFDGLEEPVAADVFEDSSMEGGFQFESVPESLDSGRLMAAVPDIEALSEEQLTVEEELPIAAMEDPLSNLRACVGSLGLELEDSIFEGMHADIDSLRNEYAAVPLARMFLQLISTATQHIETYRYEASAEAFSILQSLTDALGEALEDPKGFSAQERLLSEMTTVLLWQKDMLDRQAVAKGGRLTFAVPVRTKAGEILEEEEISFEEEEIEERDSAAIEPAVEEEPVGGGETGRDLFTAAETVALDSEDIFAAEDLVAEVAEVQDQRNIASMDDDSYTALADDLAGERLAVTGAEGSDERLARQIRELIRSEVELIRQEMQSGMESLRKELLDKEN
ncbi:hypothetical protein JT06_09865 [Desulfobulbus sp. Tol-SR]|nr:hypothetical protein JT06_09865 [Desulfobulbus sp. Tol-SR]